MDFLNSINLGPFSPPSGPWMTAFALLQCLMVIANGPNEVANPAPYSKFATHTATLPSRVGMTLIYAPSFLVAVALIAFHQEASATLASYFVAIHFAKRTLESLFLHKYSGSMDFGAGIGISTFYTLTSILLIFTAEPLVWSEAQTWGTPLFVIGELGNLYHHWLLRQLRGSKDESVKGKRYIPPTGGLFHFAAAPHYLFEITAFLGIALASQSIHALLVALSMASYLAGRSVGTLRFYQGAFGKAEWSRDKKAMIPFIF